MLLEVQVGLSALPVFFVWCFLLFSGLQGSRPPVPLAPTSVPLALGWFILTGRLLAVLRCILFQRQWVLNHVGMLYTGAVLQPSFAVM